jgi:hypothetical protein
MRGDIDTGRLDGFAGPELTYNDVHTALSDL